MIQIMKKRILSTFIPAVLAALMIPTAVFAAESCEVSIPVSLTVSGSSIPSATYRMVIEAVTEEAPMPAETTVTLTGAGSSSFGPITYTTPGDYQYRIYQDSEAVNRFTYDTSEYTLTVRILNNGNGSLVSEVWAVNSADTATKLDSITFANTYSKASSGGSSSHGGSSSGGSSSSSSGGSSSSSSGPGVSSSDSGDYDSSWNELTPIEDGGIPTSLSKTGDTTQTALLAVLCVGSLLLLAAIFLIRRKFDMDICHDGE